MAGNESPFICAYVLDRHGSGIAADAAAVSQWSRGDGLLWVHLDVLSESAHAWLDARTDIDELTRVALMTVETRPRAVPTDRGLLIVLRGVNMNPGADPDDMVAVRLWMEPDRIISSRRRKLMSIQDIRDSIEAGTGPTTSGEFLTALVERLADRIGHVVDEIEAAVDEAEEWVLGEYDPSLRAELGVLRRRTAAIRRYLAPQRDALDRLYRAPGDLLSSVEANELREQADRITRYLEDLDLARERAVLLQEEMLGQMAHEQNSRMYLLSVVAAVFLPLTFVTGLLGMNVAGLPGTEAPSSFWLSLLAMVGLGIVLVVYFKWKKWI
jgi:zinc transporter